jgi:hypothetical protein
MRIPRKNDGIALPKKATAVVKGPITCHNCQLKCVDAAEYLNHKCQRSTPRIW